VVYTIAAYSITAAALLLYGALMQHRGRVLTADLQTAMGVASQGPVMGFNLGACLLAPIWMWVHGLRVLGAILLLTCLAIWPLYQQELWIPLILVTALSIAAGVALGLVGNRIALAHLGPLTPGAFSARQLPWALSGIALYSFVLPWVIYFTTRLG
jgi:hypothetical protein